MLAEIADLGLWSYTSLIITIVTYIVYPRNIRIWETSAGNSPRYPGLPRSGVSPFHAPWSLAWACFFPRRNTQKRLKEGWSRDKPTTSYTAEEIPNDSRKSDPILGQARSKVFAKSINMAGGLWRLGGPHIKHFQGGAYVAKPRNKGSISYSKIIAQSIFLLECLQ